MQDSPAVKIKTRELLAPSVHALVTSTLPNISTSEFFGIDQYMELKTKAAQLIGPGSVQVLSRICFLFFSAVAFAAGATWGSMDEWVSMSRGALWTALTPTVLAAGSLPSMSSWFLVDRGWEVSWTQDFWVEPSVGTMGGSITVKGVTYPEGTATHSLALNNDAWFTYVKTYSVPRGKQQVVANGFITFGWAPASGYGGYFDLVLLHDSNTGAVALQFNNGTLSYNVHIETADSHLIGRSAHIAIVPFHRYSFSLLFDEVNGLARLAIFDPSNNFKRVGSTVTERQSTGSTLSSVYFGNAEIGTSSGTRAHFEDLMLDWTNHVFPNRPH